MEEGKLYYHTIWALEGKTQQSTSVIQEPAGQFVEGLQVFTSDDVAKHQDETSGIWM